MTVRNALTVAVLAMVLIAVPPLPPAPSVALAQNGSEERIAAAPLPDDAFHARLTLQPIGYAPTTVTLDLYEEGTLVEPLVAEIPRNGNLVITETGTADGFIARSPDDFAIMVRWSENPDGTGLGGAYPVRTMPEFGPSYTPFLAPSDLGSMTGALRVINAGDVEEFGDTYTYVGGERSLMFHGAMLAPGEVATATLDELPEIEANVRSALLETYSSGSPAHQTLLEMQGETNDPFMLSRLPSAGAETLYIPGVGQEEPSSVTCYVANRDLTVQSVTVTPFDDTGEPLDATVFELAARELKSFASTGASVRIESDSDRFGAGCVDVHASDAVDATFESMATVRRAGRIAGKRAKLFGAPASGASRVAVGIHNPGSRQLKARVILRDGAGDVAMARTIRVRAGRTNFLNYRPRAFGPDTWAEVKIRGDREGVPFLLQVDKASGDLTYYPATVIR